MFTGIVEEVGEIAAAERRADVLVVRVRARAVAAGWPAGASIAVERLLPDRGRDERRRLHLRPHAGDPGPDGFAERLVPGALVNLERPMRADGRFDGHIVQGHVDGVGEIRPASARATARAARGRPARLERYLVEKGSIAVDGISLTVAGLRRRRFLGRGHPVYTGAYESPGGASGRPGEPGDRRDREIRREAPRPRPPARSARPDKRPMPFASIPDAIEDIRQGRMVVVVDDEDRENEGDLTIAAEKVTPRSSTSWPATGAASSACP
jgi:hypothetical protein